MRSCAQTQPKSLSRGMQNHFFTDHDNIYYSIGAQPGRAEKGVQSGLYKTKHGFPNHHWDSIHKLLKCAECVFVMFMDTEVIWHIVQARRREKFWTTKPSPSGLHAKSARYYNAVDFGINVFLRCHMDKDFTMLIVQVHLDEIMYQNDDRIVCFFAFPQIGIAVPVQPGDTLMFNPQEPHCGPEGCPNNLPHPAWHLTKLFFWSDLSWSQADLCANSYVISTRFSLLSMLPLCTRYTSYAGILRIIHNVLFRIIHLYDNELGPTDFQLTCYCSYFSIFE